MFKNKNLWYSLFNFWPVYIFFQVAVALKYEFNYGFL